MQIQWKPDINICFQLDLLKLVFWSRVAQQVSAAHDPFTHTPTASQQ